MYIFYFRKQVIGFINFTFVHYVNSNLQMYTFILISCRAKQLAKVVKVVYFIDVNSLQVVRSSSPMRQDTNNSSKFFIYKQQTFQNSIYFNFLKNVFTALFIKH